MTPITENDVGRLVAAMLLPDGIELIADLADYVNAGGGYGGAHIVVDDANIDEDSIVFASEACRAEDDTRGVELLERLSHYGDEEMRWLIVLLSWRWADTGA